MPISGNYLAKVRDFHHGRGMIKPQPMHTANVMLDITSVRTQIDAIDGQLAALIVRRCGLSASVASAKRAAGDAAFGWRPAREVEILRSVLRQQASLDPELAFSIWRALISANLAAQGTFRIIALTDTARSAKAAFSVGPEPEIVADVTTLFDILLRDDHVIGALPWPTGHAWWVTMMAPHYSALHVCATSPLSGRDPEILLVSGRTPEPAGDDISLIAGPIGSVEGGVLAQVGELELVACGEFMRAGSDMPHGCRLIGSFAVV